MITYLFAALAVSLFILGLSITTIRKGRDLQSDVGSNDDMKRLGLECASQAARREEAALRGEVFNPAAGCTMDSCSTCISCEDELSDNCSEEQADNSGNLHSTADKQG